MTELIQPTGPNMHNNTVAPEHDYAGFWIRVIAALIDFVLVAIIGIICLMIFGQEFTGSWLYTIALMLAYYAWPESSPAMQGSLGKYVLGLKIIRTDGDKISFLRAICRNISKYLSAIILMIGYIMVAFHKKKRGLHDIICETYVVRR